MVHPSLRRLHRKHKREKDPDRQSYVNLLKQANEYVSSSDSLVASPDAIDSGFPLIGLDTPDSLSADEGELTHTVSDPQIRIDESHFTGEERPSLRHSITAPGRVDTPSTDAEAAAALEGPREKVSHTEKG